MDGQQIALDLAANTSGVTIRQFGVRAATGSTAPDTDGDTDGVAPEAPTTAPEVPAVVQTDGAALETPAPLAPVGLGLLAVGGLVGVLRRLARA